MVGSLVVVTGVVDDDVVGTVVEVNDVVEVDVVEGKVVDSVS